jgi:sigma-B regulation protein RsbU (phosphoserine phosphatase)
MSGSIRHQLCLDAGPAAAGEASLWVRMRAEQHQLPDEWSEGLDLAAVELVANICDYGYRGRQGEIRLMLELSHTRTEFTLEDDAPAFDPSQAPPPQKATSLDDAQIGGLGIFLVRQMSQSFVYERTGSSNRLVVGFGDPAIASRGLDRRQAGEPGTDAQEPECGAERRIAMDRRQLAVISSSPLFIGVPYDEIEGALKACPIVSYRPGAIVRSAGNRPSSVGLLLSGVLAGHVGQIDGAPNFEIQANECFGEMSVADGKPASAWLVAATECSVLEIDADIFLHQVLTVPRIGRNLIVILSDRARRHGEEMAHRARVESELGALQRELDFAERIQASMLPLAPIFPDEPRLDCVGHMHAARQVGGDFFEALPLDADRYLVAIGDVCNKGMPAALFMTQTLTMLRGSAARGISDPELDLEVLARQGNDLLCQGNSEHLFVSLFIAVIDLKSERLRYVNAGHNPPWLLATGSAPSLITHPRNPVAGMIPGLTYKSGSVAFPRGSLLLLYTDGVTEAENVATEQFGDERLAALVSEPPASAQALVARIVAAVDAFAGAAAQADDITLLAAHFK